jgi:hypothetical protein
MDEKSHERNRKPGVFEPESLDLPTVNSVSHLPTSVATGSEKSPMKDGQWQRLVVMTICLNTRCFLDKKPAERPVS